MEYFIKNNNEILQLVNEWEPKLLSFPTNVITQKRNSQGRTIKQVLGHLVDSASNNNHRIVHLQYRENPLEFPNYATNGNKHFVHVVNNINPDKLDNAWISSPNKSITLKEMVLSYLDHLKLHLKEIDDLNCQA